MKFNVINYDESLTEQIVLMWRPSKVLAYGQEDIHSFDEDVQFIKDVLSKENKILLATELKSDWNDCFYPSNDCSTLCRY